jgi:hypothetical protein
LPGSANYYGPWHRLRPAAPARNQRATLRLIARIRVCRSLPVGLSGNELSFLTDHGSGALCRTSTTTKNTIPGRQYDNRRRERQVSVLRPTLAVSRG